VDLAPLSPVIHGALLGGKRPLYLSAHLIGHHSHHSSVSNTAPQPVETTVSGGWLGRYLKTREPAASS
jgi:hypothetical protein